MDYGIKNNISYFKNKQGNSMNKILIVSNLFPPNIIGGAEKIAYEVAQIYSKSQSIEVIVATLSNSSHDKIYSIDGLKVYALALEDMYYPYDNKNSQRSKIQKLFWHYKDIKNVSMSKKVEKIILEEKPNIIMTHTIAGFSVEVWNIAKKYDLKTIHVLHDHYLMCPKSTMYKNGENCKKQCFDCKLFSMYKKESSKNVDIVVGVSKYILNRHTENGYFLNAKKIVIHNAIEFKSEERNDNTSKSLIFGFIGRLSPEKGIEELLYAFKQYFPNEKIVIAGTGDDKFVTILKNKFESENRVFLGFTKPEEYYKNIDINIVPSRLNETFGMVALEALKYGIPVIAAKRGGLVEVIEEGINGYLYEPSNNSQLIDIINLILSNPTLLENLKFNALLSAKKFDYSFFRTQYIELIVK